MQGWAVPTRTILLDVGGGSGTAGRESPTFLSNKTWESKGLGSLNRFTVTIFACLFAYNSETLEKHSTRLKDYIC